MKSKQNSNTSSVEKNMNLGFNHGFWGTLITLLVIVGGIELYGALTIHQQIKDHIQNTPTTLSSSSDSRPANEGAFKWREKIIDDTFNAASKEYKNLNVELKKTIRTSFAQSKKNLDQRAEDWADWYFSVIGEYARLGHLGAQALGKSSLDEYMLNQLSKKVFGPAQVFENLSQLNQEIEQRYSDRHQAVMSHLHRVLQQHKLESNAEEQKMIVSRMEKLNQLNHIATISPLALASKLTTLGGVKLGLKYLTTKSSMKLVSSGLAKGGAKVATTSAAKGAVKAGTKVGVQAGAHGSALASGVSATALCAPLGLIAPLCGVTAGVATWFAVDKVIVEVDELINRDEFVAQTKAELANIISHLEQETLADLDRYEAQVIKVIVYDQEQQLDQEPVKTRLIDQLDLPVTKSGAQNVGKPSAKIKSNASK